MDTSGVIQLISIIVLIFLSGFFSSAETALSTVNRVRMRSLEEEGNKRAARVNKILDNYSKMISTILIGNNIVNLTAASLATTLLSKVVVTPNCSSNFFEDTSVLVEIIILPASKKPDLIIPPTIELPMFPQPTNPIFLLIL